MHIILIYFGMLFGIFLEGEMVMISAVIAAHHGYLDIWIVLVIGLIGTYCSDCFYFFLGRKKGRAWLNQTKKFTDKLVIVDQKLKKYPVLIFIGYRFLYGFRTIVPLTIGTGETRTSTFLFFSALSTFIWATVYCTIGYIFGTIIKAKLGHIEHMEKYIIGVLLVIGIVLFVVNRIKKIVLKRSFSRNPAGN
jgi:membrane protein DedA with SNARE-associated domain